MTEAPSPLLHTAATIALVILMLSLALALWRLARGPALPDRVVTLDLVASIVLGIIAAYSVLSGVAIFLNAAVLLALIAFLGTVAFARYLERGVK
ncbi:MAG: monovalent cation/H+ antiporter complex subunit F [Bacteroidia bacterium]|nr:monovalent cation/H+ antiporter complex subunit F [Bacteroidia bacterium]